MALSCKTGQINSPTSTGNQAYTGIGFQPKALILWSDAQAANGAAASMFFGFGMATSSSARGAVTVSSLDGSGSSSAHRGHAAKAFTLTNSGTPFLVADFVSFGADGFTLNWSAVAASGRVINYMAIGGADLSNAKVVQITSPTSTGSQATTGVGFQPDVIMAITVGNATAPDNDTTTELLSIGAATGSAQMASGISGINGSPTTDTERAQVADKVIHCTFQNAVFLSASRTSLDADGFTLNWTTVAASARYCFVLCLEGTFQSRIGTETQKTSTGTKATTGVGFQPTGLLLGTVCNTNSASIVTNARLCVGASDGTTHVSQWIGDKDNNAGSSSSRYKSATEVIRMATEAGASPTTEAAASVSSLDSDGYTLNWGTADATAREFWYLALGSAGGGGGGNRRRRLITGAAA